MYSNYGPVAGMMVCSSVVLVYNMCSYVHTPAEYSYVEEEEGNRYRYELYTAQPCHVCVLDPSSLWSYGSSTAWSGRVCCYSSVLSYLLKLSSTLAHDSLNQY